MNYIVWNTFSSVVNMHILKYSNDQLVTAFFPSTNLSENTFVKNLNGISFSDYVSKTLFDKINSKYCFKENKNIIITYNIDPSVLLLNDLNTSERKGTLAS